MHGERDGEEEIERDFAHTSAPVLAAVSTTRRSWSDGMDPVEPAPILANCFWLGISDNTAFVHNFLMGLVIKYRFLSHPCWKPLKDWNFALNSGWKFSFGRFNGEIDLGFRQSFSGVIADDTKHFPILEEKWKNISCSFLSQSPIPVFSFNLVSVRQRAHTRRLWRSITWDITCRIPCPFACAFILFFALRVKTHMSNRSGSHFSLICLSNCTSTILEEECTANQNKNCLVLGDEKVILSKPLSKQVVLFSRKWHALWRSWTWSKGYVFLQTKCKKIISNFLIRN